VSDPVQGKRVAILQSNYIPWKGYFDVIALADAFVLYDDVQYTKNDWRNRNRVKTPNGTLWLTIPVALSGRFGQRIDETRVTDQRWRAKHWRTIEQNYARAPHFADYREQFEDLYLRREDQLLTDINRSFVDAACACLGIETPISRSTEYATGGDRTHRLIDVCQALGADIYLSGPSATAYLDERAFTSAGISVEYMDYSGYPEYPQPYPPFEHAVSVLDLLFCTGAQARTYMKSQGRSRAPLIG
jgi:hypothetical protein